MRMKERIGVAFIGCVGAFTIYYLVGKLFHVDLHRDIITKLEKVADSDNNGKLSIDEISSVYQTLGMNPAEEMMHRGLNNLKNSEIQNYFKIKGKYDSSTDEVSSFWLPKRND